MIKLLQIVTISILLPFSAISGAQQRLNQPLPPPGMGGMGNMDQAEMTDHLKQMLDGMLIMHDLSNKILAEKPIRRKNRL